VSEILAALHRDHRNLGQLLAAMERQLTRFDRGEAPDYDILQGVLDYCLTYPDLYHHPKEDLVYDRLRHRNPAAIEAIGDLQAEHRTLAETTRRFGAALRSILQEAEFPRESFDRIARTFLEAYRRHMAMEEGTFFPAARAHLTAADWTAIDAEMKAQKDPVFGGTSEARYAALRADILAWAKEED
jgi:hemerythrin-like domain-containing protein